MKPYGKCLIILLVIGVMGCGPTVYVNLSNQQEDAFIRGGGIGLALTVKLVKPEIVPIMKIYCERYLKVKDAIEGQEIMRLFASYMSDKYTGNKDMGIAFETFLYAIGYDQDIVRSYLGGKIDDMVKIEDFSENMFRRSLLAMTGFCEVL